MNKQKIWIDTDIGDDIDDAFALALALASQEIEVVGITTVFRNTAERAQQVGKLLSAAGATVPVYAGERLPLSEPVRAFDKDDPTLAPERQHPCQWEPSYGEYAVTEGGTERLIEAAERYGSALTVVAIGPLTDLAAAIRRAPLSMQKLGGITLMGGWYTVPTPEWNILCDPEAADTVFSCGIPVRAVGLDVTLQCTLEPSLLQRLGNSTQPVNGLLHTWLSRWSSYFSFDKSVLHDPLAVATLLSDVCTFERRFVKVDLGGDKRGATLCSATPQAGYAPVQVAAAVDREAFMRLFADRLL